MRQTQDRRGTDMGHQYTAFSMFGTGPKQASRRPQELAYPWEVGNVPKQAGAGRGSWGPQPGSHTTTWAWQWRHLGWQADPGQEKSCHGLSTQLLLEKSGDSGQRQLGGCNQEPLGVGVTGKGNFSTAVLDSSTALGLRACQGLEYSRVGGAGRAAQVRKADWGALGVGSWLGSLGVRRAARVARVWRAGGVPRVRKAVMCPGVREVAGVIQG